MIIPHGFSRQKIKLGDKVVVKNQINKPYFLVTVGHVLTYVGYDDSHNPGGILKDEETGLLIERVSILDFSLYEPDIETARYKYVVNENKNKVIDFLNQSCPFMGSSNTIKGQNCPSCTINKGSLLFSGQCKPHTKCLEYLSNNHYKDNEFITGVIRSLKMKRIKNVESI